MKQTILSLLLLLLWGCGQSGKVDTKLEIKQTFLSTSFPNGIVITGQGPGGKRFSVALTDGEQTTVRLDTGNWTFSAIGWDDGSATLPNNAFEGSTYCGSVSKTLTTSSETIPIPLTTGGCSQFQFQSVMTSVCGVFSKYSAAGTWSPLAPTDDNYCDTVPADMRGNLRGSYRLAAVDSGFGKPTVATMFSECKVMNNTERVSAPTSDVPLMVIAYPDSTACQNRVGGVPFFFKDGIFAGSPDFQSIFQLNDVGLPRLLLPAFPTRRGSSPFMAEMPKIGCGTSGVNDCVSAPSTGLADVFVQWMEGNQDGQIVLKNFKSSLNSCLPSAIGNSRFFFSEGCELKDGNVFMKLRRNPLTCAALNRPDFTSIKDLYRRGDRIWVLDINSQTSNHRFSLYTKTGAFLAGFPLATNDYVNIAAEDNGNVYVSRNNNTIEKYVYDAVNRVYNFSVTSATQPATSVDLEVIGNRILYAAGTTIYHFTPSLVSAGSPKTYADTITTMAFSGSDIYVSYATLAQVGKSAYDGTTIATPSNINVGSRPLSFSISDGRLYLAKSSSMLDIYTIGGANVATGLSSPFPATVQWMISFENSVYAVANAGDNHITSAFYNGTTLANISINSMRLNNNCQEAVTLALPSNPTISITSKATSVYEIFNDLIRLTGFNNLPPQALTYFEAVDNNDNRPRFSGHIGNAREMLGPSGIGAAFSDFNSCADVMSAAAAGPFYRELTFTEKGQTMKYGGTVSLVTTSALIPDQMCDDSVPEGATCSGPRTYYDLKITAKRIGSTPLDGDRMVLYLKCGAKLGSLENLKNEPGRTERELIHWNTAVSSFQRYQRYTYEKQGTDRLRLETVKFNKTSSTNFMSRQVGVETSITQSSTRGRVHEMQLSGTNVYSTQFDIQDTIANFPSANYSIPQFTLNFDQIRDNLTFSTYGTRAASMAMVTSNNNVGAVNNNAYTSSPTFSFYNTLMSEGYDLSIDNLADLEEASPTILDAFTLQPTDP